MKLKLLLERKVKVPEFKKSKDAEKFYNALGPTDVVAKDVFDPETGEVFIEKGHSKRTQKKNAYKSSHKSRPKDSLKDRLEDYKESKIYYFSKFDDIRDFQDHYNVKIERISKGWDKESINRLRDGEYDVDHDMPKLVMRQDKKSFDQNDIENISLFITKYRKQMKQRGGNELFLTFNGLKKGSKKITFDVEPR